LGVNKGGVCDHRLCFAIKSGGSVDDSQVGIVLGSLLCRNRDVSGGTLTGKRSSDTRRAGLSRNRLLIRPRGVTHVENDDVFELYTLRSTRLSHPTPMVVELSRQFHISQFQRPTPNLNQVTVALGAWVRFEQNGLMLLKSYELVGFGTMCGIFPGMKRIPSGRGRKPTNQSCSVSALSSPLAIEAAMS
jgi:hypothetical protein